MSVISTAVFLAYILKHVSKLEIRERGLFDLDGFPPICWQRSGFCCDYAFVVICCDYAFVVMYIVQWQRYYN